MRRVAVMYAGRLVEEAPVDDLFATPRHPYAQGSCAPRRGSTTIGRVFTQIEGHPPDMRRVAEACAFAERCPAAVERCRSALPPVETGPDGRRVACFRAGVDAFGSAA